MIKEIDFQSTLESAFLTYGASVAQERAIPDVRDGLKIGLRQGLYAQYSNGLTAKDKYQKAQKSVAAAMAQSYVHGDVAMYDTFIRAAKPWAYRYPIEDAQGAVGSPSSPDDHSAARYVEMRSAKLADYFFTGLKKEAVKEWYDNYDDTEKIPSVFPSIGFWNVVNGSSGIAVAMVTSVPQFNLKEVNDALIKIIKNPEVGFDDIYCAPDFATGGYLINPDEVKEGLKIGEGSSIRLRAKLEYDSKENMIKATELPYGVYTNVIMKQLADITNADDLYGIKKVIDHTKKYADIRIYLNKDVDAEKMKRKLYADTSLEDTYLINMVMLDKGRFPKVFGWREACDAYINHIKDCKRNEITFDLNKALARKNILAGLLQASANIDEIIKIIKASSNYNEASDNLKKKYSFNDEQVNAILAMKLSALTKIDGVKIKDEDAENDKFIASCRYLLDTPSAFNKELIKILKEVADKYGDNRRTEIVTTINEVDIPEDEEAEVYVSFYDNSTIKISQMKDKKDAGVIFTSKGTTNSIIGVFTDNGKYYSVPVNAFKINIIESLYKHLKIGSDEKILYRGLNDEFNDTSWLVFVTEQGMIKKTISSEYLTIKAKSGTIGCKLKDEDKLINVVLSADDCNKIMLVSDSGNYTMYEQNNISPVGRVACGVKGIKLTDTEKVMFAKVFNGDAEVITFTTDGKGKRTQLKEFPETSRAVKGNAVMKIAAKEKVSDIILAPIGTDKIKIGNKVINVADIPLRARIATGKKIL